MLTLITGSSGFIGSKIKKKLLSKKVKIISLNKKKNNNLKRILNLINSGKITEIIHCATDYGRKKTSKRSSVLKTNYVLPKLIYEECKNSNVKKFFNLDTSLLIKNKNNPSYNYVFSKNKFINLVKKQKLNVPIFINLKIHNVFDAENNNYDFVSYAIKCFRDNKNEIIINNPNLKRDFLHIKNFLEIFNKIYSKKIAKLGFKEFDVRSGNKIKLINFVLSIKKYMKSKIKIKIKSKNNHTPKIKYGNLSYFRKLKIRKIDLEVSIKKMCEQLKKK